MLRTYQPKKRQRSKEHGFMKTDEDPDNGRKVSGQKTGEGQSPAFSLKTKTAAWHAVLNFNTEAFRYAAHPVPV